MHIWNWVCLCVQMKNVRFVYFWIEMNTWVHSKWVQQGLPRHLVSNHRTYILTSSWKSQVTAMPFLAYFLATGLAPCSWSRDLDPHGPEHPLPTGNRFFCGTGKALRSCKPEGPDDNQAGQTLGSPEKQTLGEGEGMNWNSLETSPWEHRRNFTHNFQIACTFCTFFGRGIFHFHPPAGSMSSPWSEDPGSQDERRENQLGIHRTLLYAVWLVQELEPQELSSCLLGWDSWTRLLNAVRKMNTHYLGRDCTAIETQIVSIHLSYSVQ